MRPDQCPRFQTCNAPVCPLDPVPTVHLGGEPVCYYLLASGKAGAVERFADDPTFAECVARLPELAERHPDIGRKVQVAARTGFRGAHLMRTPATESLPEGAGIGVTAAG